MIDRIAFECRVIETSRGWSSPQPTEGQLGQILARRRAGHRLALPLDAPYAQRHLLWWISVAAAVGFLVLSLIRSTQTDPRMTENVPDFMTTPLMAQATEQPREATIGILDGSRLRSGRWIYARFGIGSVNAQGEQRRDSLSVRDTPWNGEPAWLIVSHWDLAASGPPKLIDSTWVTRDSLRPIATVMVLRSGSRMETRFEPDSVRRDWRRVDGSVEHLAVVSPHDPGWNRGFVFTGIEEAPFFPLFSLQPHWRGSLARVALVNSGALVTVWTNLRVAATERIAVPAGNFDCWKVVDDGADDSKYAFWVDRSTGMVVRQGLTTTNQGPFRQLVSYTQTP